MTDLATREKPCTASPPSEADLFRRVFAESDEVLILAIAGGNGSSRPGLLAELIRTGDKATRKLRWLLKGVPPALREEVKRGTSHGGNLHFLEDWTNPVLVPILSVVDAIILLEDGELPPPELEGFPWRVGPAAFVPHGTRRGPLTSLAGAFFEFDPRLPGSLRSLLEGWLQGPILSEGRKGPLRSPEPDSPVSAPGQHSDRPHLVRSLRKTGDYILHNDWGIGDELLLSAVARELVRSVAGIRVWIRSRFGFRFPDYVRKDPVPPEAVPVETIYQNATLYGPRHHSPYPGHLVQQMLDKFTVDTGIKVIAKDVRPELVVSEGAAGGRDPKSIVVHSRPNPRLPSKDWGIDRWGRLCEILHSSGIDIRQVGAADEPLLPYARDLRGTAPGDLADVVARSGAVVSLVGLLMHVAVATRTPAVVIYGGREHPAIDGYLGHIHLRSDPLSCRGRWGCHLAPDTACPHGMRCMNDIAPELVAREVGALLAPSGGREGP